MLHQFPSLIEGDCVEEIFSIDSNKILRIFCLGLFILITKIYYNLILVYYVENFVLIYQIK